MGMFSYTCAHCGRSLLSQHSPTTQINDWMRFGRVITPKNRHFVGVYDGYGRGFEIDLCTAIIECGSVIVHTACWQAAGKPGFSYYQENENKLTSRSASDQGHCLDFDKYNMRDPGIEDPITLEKLSAIQTELHWQDKVPPVLRTLGPKILEHWNWPELVKAEARKQGWSEKEAKEHFAWADCERAEPWRRRFVNFSEVPETASDWAEPGWYVEDWLWKPPFPEKAFPSEKKAAEVAKLHWETWLLADPVVAACQTCRTVLAAVELLSRMVSLRLADWTDAPGGRQRETGPFSGQEYREDIVTPAFMEAHNKDAFLCIDLDGVQGYAASFLDEVFYGLAKEFGAGLVLGTVKLVCNESPETILEIHEFIHEAKMEA